MCFILFLLAVNHCLTLPPKAGSKLASWYVSSILDLNKRANLIVYHLPEFLFYAQVVLTCLL